MGDQNRILDVIVKRGKIFDAWLVVDHPSVMPWIGSTPWEWFSGINQSERPPGQDGAVDHANARDGDDFISFRRPKAGGFQVENDDPSFNGVSAAPDRHS